jgi:UDP-glucose 4-epimerase
MKIMVTGGAGFVGTNLIKRLLKDGHEVVSIDNYSTGTEENHQEGCVYHDVDIRDAVDFDFFMEEPDVIYHLAALARIQPSFEFPALTFEMNVLGTMNILEWARTKECKVIYAGSSSHHNGMYENPYTFTKELGEQLCTMYNKVYNVDTKVCRFYNAYGEYQLLDSDYAAVVGIFVDQHKNNKPLTIVGDGEQRRDFTHIDDIIEGLTLATYMNSGTYELGSGKNYSINELADMFGKDYPREYIDERPGEARETLCKGTILSPDNKALENYIKSVISE